MSRRPEYLFTSLLLLMLAATSGHATSGLLTDALGRWLDTEVLPSLGTTLGEHPRFKGETIKLVSLENGKPTRAGSRLHQAVQAHVRERLLRRSGVRIAWSEESPRTCGISQPPVYLLGVEIERDGSRYHKLNIAMIDVAESVWVSGVNHTWRGRLTATEKAALNQSTASAPAGTVDNPMPVGASTEIARAMHRHLQCAHPEGLDGPVYLEPGDSPELNRIMASLSSELATAPIAAVTRRDGDADWVLRLVSSDSRAGTVTELGLMLSDAEQRLNQQVATIYVSGTRRTPAGTRVPAGALVADNGPGLANRLLLTDMAVEPAAHEGICRSQRGQGSCAEISFQLLEPAYLFVLSSRNRELSATSCESRLVEASTGERRYRVRVWPNGNTLPDAGLYAIAVTDRAAARALSHHIRTGVCSRPLSRSNRWLAELDEFMNKHADTTQWQAIHLADSPGGVIRF